MRSRGSSRSPPGHHSCGEADEVEESVGPMSTTLATRETRVPPVMVGPEGEDEGTCTFSS
jgi:hypothetical protein